MLKKYPRELVMDDGYITGGHGIQFDLRTINSLKRKGIIVNGKLSEKYK